MGTCVSVDLGSSITKGVINEGEEVGIANFPSIVVPVDQPLRHGCIQVRGQWWVYGGQALLEQRALKTQPQQGAEYHGSLTQRVLTCAALKHLLGGCFYPEVEKLAMGLPYVLVDDAAAMRRMTDFCESFVWSDHDGEHVVSPKEIYLPAQGSGALIQHLREHPEDRAGLIVVVDIGGQTADCVAQQDGQIVRACSRSINVNVLQFFTMLVAHIQQDAYPIERAWDYHDVMQRLRRRGSVELRGIDGRKKNIDANIAQVRAAWTDRLHAAVSATLGGRWADVDQLIFTGGGAALVDTKLWHGKITVMDDMANVRGQLMALQGE